MRPLAALASFAAVIGLAVPAHADPSGDDADFLAALKQAGITYTDGDKAVAAGKTVCDQMDHGQSATDVVKNLTDANPGFTQEGAAKFTATAANAYCPETYRNGHHRPRRRRRSRPTYHCRRHQLRSRQSW